MVFLILKYVLTLKDGENTAMFSKLKTVCKPLHRGEKGDHVYIDVSNAFSQI